MDLIWIALSGLYFLFNFNPGRCLGLGLSRPVGAEDVLTVVRKPPGMPRIELSSALVDLRMHIALQTSPTKGSVNAATICALCGSCDGAGRDCT